MAAKTKSTGTITATKTVRVADLAVHHNNPRRGDPKAIARSLKSLGQYRPIVVNKGTHTGYPNEVLAGNHTLMAARDLGWETIEATFVDVDSDVARRITIADNRLADLGDYDDQLLLDMLDEIDDPIDVGYSGDEIEQLRAALDVPDFNPEGDEDMPRLDRKSVTDCPNCGHTFTPETRSIIVGEDDTEQ